MLDWVMSERTSESNSPSVYSFHSAQAAMPVATMIAMTV